ncbi:MAG TPA: hypothetical protein VG916_14685, partial [Gemmatimonadaceae bacterium]|nr:hypothetical protein [Gemmatimonadaceae bacterium]
MQGAAAPQAPATPTPPAAPGAVGGAKVAVPTVVAVPTTAADVRAIRARRDEISSQIGNVTGRRNEIASQLRAAAPGADRAGLEARLAQLDKRIVDLEKELDVTGMQLAAARGQAAITVEQPTLPRSGKMDSDQITAVAIVFTLAVMMPLSIAWARAITRRSRHATERPSPELSQRLDRMEEGIDAIAIEVERISEGQRFVSKLIGEGAAQPLRAGAAIPVAAGR